MAPPGAADYHTGLTPVVRMRVAYHPDYRVYLPPTHPFPMGKYPLLYERLLAAGTVRREDVMTPEEAPLEWLTRVHAPAYLERVATGTLSDAEVRRLGVPWSAHLWRRSRLAAHGTYLAARAALRDGLAGNLAGGTHHAYPDHGEGFCVLNDVAIAIRQLRVEHRVGRVLIVDLDVHQGNGTAAIFAADPDTYTLSLHGERNYPLAKERSSLDVGLPDGLDDDGYLAALADALPRAIADSRADLAFYLGGVDVVAGDRYGKLRLTDDGLRRREAYALGALRDSGIPVALTLAGGYAPTPLRTAELHSYAFDVAAARLRAELSS
jgi:acetoin utilization deacetylase AcuC-like enzyme